MTPIRPLAATLLWLIAAPAAAAPPAQGGTRPLLVYGPGNPSPTLENRAVAAYDLQRRRPHASPVLLHVDDLLASVDDLQLIGEVERWTCGGQSVPLPRFLGLLEQAETNTQYVRVAEATAILDALDGELPCLDGVLQRRDLAWISFLEGIVLAWDEQPDAAREAFREALIVAPELDWDDRFPPDLEPLFNDALRLALRTPSANLEVGDAVVATGALWIDGAAFDGAGDGMPLPQGRHLIQWQLEGEPIQSVVVVVDSEDRLVLLSRADIASAVLSSRGLQLARDGAAAELRRAASEAGTDEVYLAELGASDLLHRFDVSSGAWTMTDAGMLERSINRRRLSRAGEGVLLAGLGTAAAGGALGVSGYLQATDLVSKSSSLQTTDDYDAANEEYHGHRARAYIGYFLAGVGVAAVAVGLSLTITGRVEPQTDRTRPISAAVNVTPSSLSLSIQF